MSGNLFTSRVTSWSEWGAVYQSIPAFEPLIGRIFANEGLSAAEVGHCTPGTNAVFRVGKYVVKIFAPAESGMDTLSDYDTELYGLSRAERLGVPAPRLAAAGHIADKYLFYYLVMERINGEALGKAGSSLDDARKYGIGRQLRELIRKMDVPCEAFNGVDFLSRAVGCPRYKKMPPSFQADRAAFLRAYRPRDKVYVHGDLTRDNALLGADGKIYIIDFADSLVAPVEYELAALVCELCNFEKPYMEGCFGTFDADTLADRLTEGLLFHDFGYNIICDDLGDPDGITSVSELRSRLYRRITSG